MTWKKITSLEDLSIGIKIRFDDRFGKFTYWNIEKIEDNQVTIINEEGDNFRIPPTLLKNVEVQD